MKTFKNSWHSINYPHAGRVRFIHISLYLFDIHKDMKKVLLII
jgi:hypothetical protein